MELLTVKNNHQNYSNFKKTRFFLFHFGYKCLFLCGIGLSLLSILISVFNGDMFEIIEYILILAFICILPFIQSEAMLKKLIKLQKEKYGSDEIIFDVIFDEDGIISVEQSAQYKSKIMYKDIKKVIETKEIILFISKAGHKTFFEKNNVESNGLEKIKKFFDKQNILWEKAICNIF